MAHSDSACESNPEPLSYHTVGYMQLSSEVMHEQVASIAQQQKEIGYESVFIEGEKQSAAYMQGLFEDWQAKGITSVLHEKKGGYANSTASIRGLAQKAAQEEVSILCGVKVTGFKKDGAGAVRTVLTDQGDIDCDSVVVGAGPLFCRGQTASNVQQPVSVELGNGRVAAFMATTLTYDGGHDD